MTFNDSEALPQFLPEGDYVVRVSGIERGISRGQKTGGSDQWTLELTVEKPLHGRCWDTLIDHKTCQWRCDTFLKCMGVVLSKGQDFSFDPDEAMADDITCINLVGLRGWAALSVEEYKGKKRNRVATYYTDRPKLPRDEPPAREEPPPWDRPEPAPPVTLDNDDEVPF